MTLTVGLRAALRALPLLMVLGILTVTCTTPLAVSGQTLQSRWADIAGQVTEAMEAETMLGDPELVGTERFEKLVEEADEAAEAGWGALSGDDLSEGPASSELPELQNCKDGSDGHGRRCREPPRDSEHLNAAELLPNAQPWWGKVGDAPTSEEYTFNAEMSRQCADRKVPLPIAKLPLSLDPRIFQQMFLSQETCDGVHFGKWTARNYRSTWDKICPMLQPTMHDVMPSDTKYKSCAVVGNNGNMLVSNFGREIDQHEAVFRLNKAPTKGFEKKVGSKMTYRFMNKRQFKAYSLEGHIYGHVEKIPQDNRGVIIVSRSPPDMMAQNIHDAIVHAKRHKSNLKFTAMSMHVFDYANNLLDTYRQCANMRKRTGDFTSSTSGMMATVLSLHLCEHVTIYGVGDTSLAKPNIPYQYFAAGGGWSSRKEVNHHHNMSLEEEFIQALAHAGIIRHCQHNGCVGDSQA